MEGMTPDMLKRLSALVRALYHGARSHPPDAFQDWALQQTRALVPFDAAKWITCSLDDGQHVLHNFHQYGMQDLNDPHKSIPPRESTFLIKAMTESQTGAGKHDSVIQDATVGMACLECHAHIQESEPFLAATMFEPTTGLLHALFFYRNKSGHSFARSERELMEFLMPILKETRSQNLFFHLNHNSSPALARAVCDCKNILLEFEPAFTTLLGMQWPEWQGPHLPFNACEVLGSKKQACLAQQSVVVGIRKWGALILLDIRERFPGDNLTDAEKRVAALLCEGLSNKEIARHLHRSEKTIDNHLQNIYRKLGVHSRQLAMVQLARHSDF